MGLKIKHCRESSLPAVCPSSLLVLESGCLDRVGTAVQLVTRIYKDISPLLSCHCLWFDPLALFSLQVQPGSLLFSHMSASALSGDELLSSFDLTASLILDGWKGDYFLQYRY